MRRESERDGKSCVLCAGMGFWGVWHPQRGGVRSTCIFQRVVANAVPTPQDMLPVKKRCVVDTVGGNCERARREEMWHGT